MKTLVLSLGLAAMMLIANNLNAQGFFCRSPYGQSLLADVHPNFVRFDIASVTNHQEWDWGQTGKTSRINTFCVMGINLPIQLILLKIKRMVIGPQPQLNFKSLMCSRPCSVMSRLSLKIYVKPSLSLQPYI